MDKPWFVYIAQAKTGRYYTGITTNPNERVKRHNSGNGSRLAVQQGPFILKWVSKEYTNKSDARTREMQLKGWSRIKKEKLISGEWE